LRNYDLPVLAVCMRMAPLLLCRLLPPPQSSLGRDKSGAQTTFDAAAASALVEMPEYRSDGLQVRGGCSRSPLLLQMRSRM
jgi:hypothetical protein